MGVKERREREKEEVREKILDAARELIVTEGFEAVSMRRIAEKIEYSAPALYFHFADKDALIRELCGRDFLQLGQAFAGLAPISDPFERLQQIGRTYVQFALAHPEQYRFMFMTPLPPMPPEGSAVEKGNPAQDAYAFLLHTVQACIFEGKLRPELTDPELVAQLVWSAAHGLITLNITLAHKSDWVEWRTPEKATEALLDMIMRGIARDGGK